MRHRRTRASRWWGLLVILLALSVVGYGAWLEFRPHLTSPSLDSAVIATDEPTPTESVTMMPVPTISARPTPDAPLCTTAQGSFVPSQVRMDEGRFDIQALDQVETVVDGRTILTSPDPLDANPRVFAWDRQSARPGSARGNVLLTAHTYPDGSALGNQLYADLQPGDTLQLAGPTGVACYQVRERQEVPIADYPLERVYDWDGSPQAIITVCSGLRLGPGDWTKRTLWFLEPVK